MKTFINTTLPIQPEYFPPNSTSKVMLDGVTEVDGF